MDGKDPEEAEGIRMEDDPGQGGEEVASMKNPPDRESEGISSVMALDISVTGYPENVEEVEANIVGNTNGCHYVLLLSKPFLAAVR